MGFFVRDLNGTTLLSLSAMDEFILGNWRDLQSVHKRELKTIHPPNTPGHLADRNRVLNEENRRLLMELKTTRFGKRQAIETLSSDVRRLQETILDLRKENQDLGRSLREARTHTPETTLLRK
jgi:hypothetical protein